MDIYNLVKKSQQKNDEALVELLERFNPLIKKYARKIRDSDAESDLIVRFIETIYKIPIEKNSEMKNENCIKKYIEQSIRHEFMHLSAKKDKIVKENTYQDINSIEIYEGSTSDDYLYVKQLLDKLPKKQR
ncbi:hypothetical protein Q428_14580, partial [Fervidicella metallireducens AeB]